MSYELTQEVVEALMAKIENRPEITLNQNTLTFQSPKNAKISSSITIPNTVPVDMVIKIINNHIKNLNNSGSKFKEL